MYLIIYPSPVTRDPFHPWTYDLYPLDLISPIDIPPNRSLRL